MVLWLLLFRRRLKLVIHLPHAVHAAERFDDRESLAFNPKLTCDGHSSILDHGS